MTPRKAPRFAIQLPVVFKTESVEATGMVLNLSSGGCAVASSTHLAQGTYPQLQIEMVEGEEPIHVELAAVRWAAGDRFGVEFIRIRPEQVDRLTKFLRTLALPGEGS
jgi:hypothetical protein